MKILAFDTATDACSVALLTEGRIFQHAEIAPRRHAELILPMIRDMLQGAGLGLNQLDAIAVGQGPGSFIGVRTAVGVAQGLAMGAGLPVIPVSTLQAIAQAAYEQSQWVNIISGWDARMQAIYWGAFSLNSENIMAPIQSEALNAPAEIKLPLEKKWRLAGNAWEVYRQELTSLDYSQDAEVPDIYPQAAAIIRLAEFYYRQGKFLAPELLEPVYLRNQVAYAQSDFPR